MSRHEAPLNYSVYGLVVRSELPLPELFPAKPGAEPEVVIDRAAVPEADAAPVGISQAGGALVLVVEGVARYRICNGRTITVDAVPGAPERNVRLFLLGSAFGAILHQRGLLPLHANAVEIDGQAVAFMGESGAGKSTLAVWFHDRGYRVVADDVCVVGFDSAGQPYTVPGLPRLRLWAEALAFTGRDPAGLAQSYIGDQSFDKYDVPVGSESSVDRELPLVAVYLLTRGERMDVRPLDALEAAEAVFAHTYRGGFVAAAKSEQAHWDACVRLIRQTPLFCLSRTCDLDQLDSEGVKLLDHIGGIKTAASGSHTSE